MTYSPWADLQLRHPHIHIEGCAEIRPARGAWVQEHQVILFDTTMTQPQRRCVLAHEIAHVDLRHTPCVSGWFHQRQERAADELAARRLIPLLQLIDGLLWSQDESELARELWVDADTVRTRLDTLTSSERDEVDARLWAREATA